MLAAHMDEIGLMVRYIDKNGFIKFSKLGGINDQMLLNQEALHPQPERKSHWCNREQTSSQDESV